VAAYRPIHLDGPDECDVGEVRAAGIRVVEDEHVSRARGGDERAHRRDRFVHGTEMHRNVGGLSDHFTGGVEQRRRTVATIANVRGYRRVNENEAHLLRDGREGVSHDLEPDGVEGHVRSTSTAPQGCTVPRHPGSTRAVASRPAKIAGPAMVTPAARSSSAQTDALTRAPRNVIGRLAPGRWTTRRASAKRGSGPSRSATTRRFTTSTRWS